MIPFILVFLATAVIDFFWAKYMTAVAAGSSVPAALWSGGITLLGAYVIVEYVHNPWLLLASVTGAVVGTYVSIELGKTE